MQKILSEFLLQKTYMYLPDEPRIENVDCDVLGAALAEKVRTTPTLKSIFLCNITWSMRGMLAVLQAVSNSAVETLELSDSQIVKVDCDVFGTALANMVQHNKHCLLYTSDAADE